MAKKSPTIATLCIDVPLFDADKASSLLRRLCHIYREEKVSLKISQQLGGLSLAITQMTGIIRHNYLTFSEFSEQYEDEIERKHLFEFGKGAICQEARGNIGFFRILSEPKYLKSADRGSIQQLSLLYYLLGELHLW